jgi:uncharacterized protein
MKINMNIVGIDLAGKMENPTGICVLKGYGLGLKTLYSNEEILKEVERINSSLIAIDAPLSLPKGRCCLEKDCKCAVIGHVRQAERDIQSYGRVLPLTFRGMKMLTLRGISLASELRKKYEVIETHPRTSQKILGFKDQTHDLNQFFKFPDDATQHELDATLAALTGLLYLKNCYMEFGDPEEGTIIIPKGHRCLKWLKGPNY